MKILALFFLGIVQGLSEFLPVSSSGHLVLFSKLFGLEESLFVSILLHMATLLSILVFFRKDVWKIVCHPFSKESMLIVCATIPTCIIALMLLPLLKDAFNGPFLSVCFLVSGMLLLRAENLSRRQQTGEIDAKTAIFMGFIQGFAVFPGISRSGSTLAAGIVKGKDKTETAKFSFLMSIPIIIASMIMEFFEFASGKIEICYPWWSFLCAFLIAFLVGIFSIKFVIKIVKKAKLKWFSVYLFAIAIVCLFVV